MKEPSFSDAFEVLCLQAAADGRGPILFGDSVPRAREALRPFFVGCKFPSVYLEFPLKGDPFLDVTLLYGELEPGTRIDSPAAADTDRLLDWFSEAYEEQDHTCIGFELDTGNPELPTAAVHFQPRSRTDLVEPFCEAIGEPERAALYLDLVERMPKGWPLSFFGLFRGRPGFPLRVCGYLSATERELCASDMNHLAGVFDEIGFSAYDEGMLAQVSDLIAMSSSGLDFQFDIYPDGHLGDILGIDTQFAVEQPQAVRASMENGLGFRIMNLLESWGAADERWKLIADAAFARSLPVELEDGTSDMFSFALMPGWVKARWCGGVLQPSKFYFLGKAGLLED